MNLLCDLCELCGKNPTIKDFSNAEVVSKNPSLSGAPLEDRPRLRFIACNRITGWMRQSKPDVRQ
jgi:hypothetical protein